MNWSIVRIIWFRELRDQLRDRRTLFMVAGLPLLLYPILGVAVLKLAVGFADRTTTVGIVNGPWQPKEFPPRLPPVQAQKIRPVVSWLTLTPMLPGEGPGLDRYAATAALTAAGQTIQAPGATGLSPLPPLAWLTFGPPVPGNCSGLDHIAGSAALASFSELALDYPLLARNGKFVALYLPHPSDSRLTPLNTAKFQIKWFETLPDNWTVTEKIDLVLRVRPDFWASLEHGRPEVIVEARDTEEASRLAIQRLDFVLAKWKKHIKEVHFVRHRLPNFIDDPFSISQLPESRPGSAESRSILDMLARVFPFMLVMWSLAGALYPAVDLCAGEKERGTMETLLISPAGREEIVWGKFLTIWVFSSSTALLNVASMGLTTWWFAGQFPHVELTRSGLFFCVLLLLPLSAFFSAVCLAIGAYARSTKEGQYYLMPLFLLTMPLIFLTLAPGVELNSFYSMLPVTGVALLMQRLMTGTPLQQPWFYLMFVMAPIALYSWLALRWAIDQFQREEVLFREAERIDVVIWIQRVFREKETRPTTAQAMFCFVLLLGLRWLSEGLGQNMPLLVRSGVIVAAFVAGPPLFMALVLTTRPRQVLALRWPAWPYLAAAMLLVPLMELGVSLADGFPRLLELLHDRQTLVTQALSSGTQSTWGASLGFVALAIATATAKELAFRGFILAGLLMRMRPTAAILVSSFLFAAYHLNVFLLPPLFLMGIVLGILALRSGSLLPGIILHSSGYILLALGQLWAGGDGVMLNNGWQYGTAAGCALASVALMWWQNRRQGWGMVEALIALPRPQIPSPHQDTKSAPVSPVPAAKTT